MAPGDWNWNQHHRASTMVAAPFAVPDPSTPSPSTFFTANPLDQQPLPTIAENHVAGHQWNINVKPSPQQVPSQFVPRRPSLPLTASRKRSRDDMADFDDAAVATSPTDDLSRVISNRRTSSPPKQAPSGSGTTTPNPSEAAYLIGVGSQQGVMGEVGPELTKVTSAGNRPILQSRKSMRLDASATKLDDAAQAALPDDARVGAAGIEHPVIDEATLILGISWTMLPSTPTMDAASRGWARYIENHFPLQAVRVIWQNKTIPAYLVSGSPKYAIGECGPYYYLFDEELTQGRLVAKKWEKTLENLKMSPMGFDDDEEVMNLDGATSAPETLPQMQVTLPATGKATPVDQGSNGANGVAQELLPLSNGTGDKMDIDG